LGSDKSSLRLVDALAERMRLRCFEEVNPTEFRSEFVPRARLYYDALQAGKSWPGTLHATLAALANVTRAPLHDVRRSHFADSFKELLPMLLAITERIRDNVRVEDDPPIGAAPATQPLSIGTAFVQQPGYRPAFSPDGSGMRPQAA
jgi:hypothetical protein